MSTITRGIQVSCAVLVVLAACTGRGSHGLVAEDPRSPGPGLLIADGCPEPVPPQADFTFTPSSHPPRTAARDAAPPRLDSLPALIEKGGCTRPGRSLEARGRQPPKPTVAARPRGPKHGPTAARPSAAKAAAKPKQAKAERPPAPAPAPAARVSESAPSGRAERGDSKQAPSSAPAAEPSSAEDAPRGPVAAEPFAPPEPCPPVAPAEPPEPPSAHTDWGVSTYLSNDDTMSLSSAQRIIFAIDGFLPLPPEHVRRHELLNYFSFETRAVPTHDDFSVLAGIAPKPGEPSVYTLSLAVQGRTVARAARRNLALTLLVDRSGSMREEGKMAFLKQGLKRMGQELKTGDMLHLVTFNTAACVDLQNFVVGRDRPEILARAIEGIQPQGNTDLSVGLKRAYTLAEASYRPDVNHRVLLITDALANTGETDPELLSLVSRNYDRRQIRLSGIGVGKEFDDRLLDRLTERGKGAYVFLGSKAEVDAVFGRRFVSLVETTAIDTRFLLHLPPSLRMNVFYGEEASTNREEVQPIHYFAGTSQLFLADLMTRGEKLRPGDMLMLGIEYSHPESGQRMLEDHAFRLGEIPEESRNVRKARLIVEFVGGLEWMARRAPPTGKARGAPRGWADAEAEAKCDQQQSKLTELARGVENDPEVRRVLGLWSRYCERFEAPRRPGAPPPASTGGWPGASPHP